MHLYSQKLVRFGLGLIVGVAILLPAQGEEAKYSIKEVMKALNKGDDAVGKKVAKGLASPEEIAKVVEYYQSLPLTKPTQGDPANWKSKTDKLLLASKNLKAAKPGALDAFKEAVNCKACHQEFKPEEKK